MVTKRGSRGDGRRLLHTWNGRDPRILNCTPKKKVSRWLQRDLADALSPRKRSKKTQNSTLTPNKISIAILGPSQGLSDNSTLTPNKISIGILGPLQGLSDNSTLTPSKVSIRTLGPLHCLSGNHIEDGKKQHF